MQQTIKLNQLTIRYTSYHKIAGKIKSVFYFIFKVQIVKTSEKYNNPNLPFN